jgi:hypothetical protein
MSGVFTRGLRRQLELEASQQLVREVVQPCSQAEGIQLVEATSNELQQLVTANIPFYQIPIE